MFNPSRADARRFFFETWSKYRSQAPLEGLERHRDRDHPAAPGTPWPARRRATQSRA